MNAMEVTFYGGRVGMGRQQVVYVDALCLSCVRERRHPTEFRQTTDSVLRMHQSAQSVSGPSHAGVKGGILS
jgi:hypothetical protein